MVRSGDQQRVRSLLAEAITILCKNCLTYKDEFCVEGLLGITLDNDEVFLVNIKEEIKEGKNPDEVLDPMAGLSQITAQPPPQMPILHQPVVTPPRPTVGRPRGSYAIRSRGRPRGRGSLAYRMGMARKHSFPGTAGPPIKRNIPSQNLSPVGPTPPTPEPMTSDKDSTDTITMDLTASPDDVSTKQEPDTSGHEDNMPEPNMDHEQFVSQSNSDLQIPKSEPDTGSDSAGNGLPIVIKPELMDRVSDTDQGQAAGMSGQMDTVFPGAPDSYSHNSGQFLPPTLSPSTWEAKPDISMLNEMMSSPSTQHFTSQQQQYTPRHSTRGRGRGASAAAGSATRLGGPGSAQGRGRGRRASWGTTRRQTIGARPIISADGHKEYRCAVCNQVYYNCSTLRRHENSVHFKRKSYTCVLCSKSYWRRDVLKNHMLNTHGHTPDSAQVLLHGRHAV